MEPGGSMPHSQGLSNNPYSELNNSITHIDTYLFKVLPKGLYPVGLPVKILKALLPSSILATCPAHLNLLDYHTYNNNNNWKQESSGMQIKSLTWEIMTTTYNLHHSSVPYGN